MQLMPQTAARTGVQNPLDPSQNVEGGTRYLRELLGLFHNDVVKALAAYNAGPQRVAQYLGVPPYRETVDYVSRAMRNWNQPSTLAPHSLVGDVAGHSAAGQSIKATSSARRKNVLECQPLFRATPAITRFRWPFSPGAADVARNMQNSSAFAKVCSLPQFPLRLLRGPEYMPC